MNSRAALRVTRLGDSCGTDSTGDRHMGTAATVARRLAMSALGLVLLLSPAAAQGTNPFGDGDGALPDLPLSSGPPDVDALDRQATGTDTAGPAGAQPTAEPTRTAPSRPTLTVGIRGELITIDPLLIRDADHRHLMSYVYEPLVRWLPDRSAVTGVIAERWEVVDQSASIWRFQLNQSATFGDRPVTATDVLFSLQRAKAEFSVLRDRVLTLNARVVDERTIEILSTTPNVHLPEILVDLPIMPADWGMAQPSNPAISPAYVPGSGRIPRGNRAEFEALGTGPYEVETLVRGERLSLVLRDEWRGDTANAPPRVEMVHMIETDDPVDIIADANANVSPLLTTPEIARAESTLGVELRYQDGVQPLFLVMNLRESLVLSDDGPTSEGEDEGDPAPLLTLPDGAGESDAPVVDPTFNPLRNVQVRDLIFAAVDREGIIDALDLNTQPLNGAAADFMVGYPEEPLSRELDFATLRDLVRGFAVEGQPLTLSIACPRGLYTFDEQLCQGIASSLQNVLISSTVTLYPRRRFIEMLRTTRSAGHHLTLMGWQPRTRDSLPMLASLFATNRPAEAVGRFNVAGLSDQLIDRAALQFALSVDGATRTSAANGAFVRLFERRAVIPLIMEPMVRAVSPGTGLVMNRDGGIDLLRSSLTGGAAPVNFPEGPAVGGSAALPNGPDQEFGGDDLGPVDFGDGLGDLDDPLNAPPGFE